MASRSGIAGLAALVVATLAFAATPAATQTYGGPVGLELFEGPNFTGRSVYFTADDHNLMNQRFNDQAMSARLVGAQSWEVCVDAEYRGGCVRLDRDEPDLRRIGMAQTISSVRRVQYEPGWNPGGYPPPGGGWDDGGESLAGRTAAFFPQPQIYGRPAPACSGGPAGGACAQRSADAFCAAQGYRGARYFSTRGGRRAPAFLEDVLCVS